MKLYKLKSMLNSVKLKKLKGKKVVLYLTTLCVIAISITIITITHKTSYLSNLVTEAEKHFFAQEYDLAIEKYSELAVSGKNSPKWNIKIAEIYSVKNDLNNSLKYIDISKKYEKIDANSYNCMVFTEFMNGKYELALKDGKIAISKYPSDKSLIKTMFTVYMANGKAGEANKSIARYPVDKNSSYDTAEYSRMLMLVDKWEEGFSELRRAFEMDKDEYKIYDVLAQISLHNKDILLQKITALCRRYAN
ncbi:MAG: tetratricopeptide (TPR) repeat protein [Clostridium sp.]|jgi:tetratricopeptide (TPR) repeat protein